jgi:hypothetical protein
MPPPPGGSPLPPPGAPPVTGGPPPPGTPPIPGAPAPYGAPPPGGPPGFGAPQFGTPGFTPGGFPAAPPPGSKVTNGLAIASLICGVLGLALFWACFVGLVLAIVAVVLGVMGRSKSRQLPGESGSGMALAGMITGGIGVALGILMVVLLFVGDSTVDDYDGVNSDPSDGVCDEDRWLQDPDC